MPSNEKLSSLSDFERLEYLLRTIRVEVHPDFEKDYTPEIDFQLMKRDGRTLFNSRHISEFQPMETKSDVANNKFTHKAYKRSIFVNLIFLTYLAIYTMLFLFLKNKVIKFFLIPEHTVTLYNGRKFKVKMIKAYPCTHHKDAWGHVLTLKVTPIDS